MKNSRRIMGLSVCILLCLCGCGNQKENKQINKEVIEQSELGFIYGFAPSPEGTYVQIEGYERIGDSDNKVNVPSSFMGMPILGLSVDFKYQEDISIPSSVTGKAQGKEHFLVNARSVVLQGNNPNLEIHDGIVFTKGKKELLYVFDMPTGGALPIVIPKETEKINDWFVNPEEKYHVAVDQGNRVYYSKNGKIYDKSSMKELKIQERQTQNIFSTYDHEASPIEKRSPYEGFSFKLVKNKQFYMSIVGYSMKDSIITLPESIGSYPVVCGEMDNKYCKELIIPKGFGGFFSTTLTEQYYPDGEYNNDDIEWEREFPSLPNLEKITLQEGNTLYTIEDNVLLSKDKKVLYGVCKARQGSYTVPNTVKEVIKGAFTYTQLQEITFGKNVEKINEYTLRGAKQIKKLTFNQSKVSDTSIKEMCRQCNLKILKVMKHNNRRVYFIKCSN